MIALTTDAKKDLQDFLAQLGTLATLNARMIDRLMKTIDRDITGHIEKRFTRGTGWAPLTAMTMKLRRLAAGGQTNISFRKRASKAGAKGSLVKKSGQKGAAAVKRLYYSKKSPRISDPFAERGFGWTGGVRDLALQPGVVKSKRTSSKLRRSFRGKGQKLLDYWHWGTYQRISRKQVGFFGSMGVRIKEGGRLVRHGRLIYEINGVQKMADRRARQFEEALTRVFDAALLRGTKIINPDF